MGIRVKPRTKDGRTGTVCFDGWPSETRQQVKSRIDWLVSNSIGPRILDIGCSDGAAAILLTRQGNSVRGVDVDADLVDDLNEMAERVLADFPYRPDFEVSSISSWARPQAIYDTVLVGHLVTLVTEPTRLMAAAAGCVRPGGRLVVVVPWGRRLGSSPQRHVYFLTDVLTFLPDEFSVTHLGVADGQIRLVAERPAVAGAGRGRRPAAEDLLEISQRAASESQQSLSAALADQADQLRRFWWRLQEEDRATYGTPQHSRAMMWDVEDHSSAVGLGPAADSA